MVETKNRAEALRLQLDADQPGWREKTRADLDLLTPGWQSFPLHIWDGETNEWVEIVLLANPERVTEPEGGIASRVRRWLGRK